MGYKRLRFCSQTGCKKYALDGSYYCEDHVRRSMYDGGEGADRKSTTKYQYMYSKKWNGASKQWLGMPEHSWCELCGKPSELVHHKTEHNGNWDLFWDRNNWQALCWSCHSKVHAQRRREGR